MPDEIEVLLPNQQSKDVISSSPQLKVSSDEPGQGAQSMSNKSNNHHDQGTNNDSESNDPSTATSSSYNNHQDINVKDNSNNGC